MHFRNYRLWKTWLEHYLKGAVSQHALTVNMWKLCKHLQNLDESTFFRFFHHFQRSWFVKSLPFCYVKSLGFLLTYWLAMPTIVFKIARICHSQFKCNYLINEKSFPNFLFHFWNLHQILNILKKKMIAIPTFFRKLQNVKDLVRPLSKKHRSRTPFDSQHVKDFQTLAKPAWEHFHHIFSSIWETLIWKISPLVIC